MVAISTKNLRAATLIALLLAVMTLAVYTQTLKHEFINYDDDKYVTKNPHILHVSKPMGLPAFKWALNSFYAANWHPLTWASHIADLHMWGTKPMGHHLTNLVLHLTNVLLLFALFSKMTGAIWKSGLVAGLFAVHPLHIESVAWVAERKDVLSTAFWMLTILAYVHYTKLEDRGDKRKRTWYALTVLLYALGLTAKPMLVSLPFVLLLLDYWPLGRIDPEGVKLASCKPQDRRVRTGQHERSKQVKNRRTSTRIWYLILEKTPLFVLSGASCVVTWLAQEKGKSMETLEVLSPGTRISNALVSYALYLWKTVWPRRLAVFYPHPAESIPQSQIFLATVIILGVSYLVYRNARHQPYLPVGWLWFLGTLIPVIGLVQVGGQAMADRYTYIPLIGIFVLVVWSIPRFLTYCSGDSASAGVVGGAIATLVLLTFTVCSYIQVGYWKNSYTLFRRALSVAKSDVAHNNLGLVLQEQGKINQAIKHFAAALAINPRFVEAQGNLANALGSTGNIKDAIAGYKAILDVRPDDHKAHNNLANALIKLGKLDEAIEHYKIAIELNPSDPVVHYNLSTALFAKKDFRGAWKEVCIARDFGFQADPAYVKQIEQAIR